MPKPTKHSLLLAVAINFAYLVATAAFLIAQRDDIELHNLIDRWQGQGTIQVHPKFVTLDRPQSLFIISDGLSSPTIAGQPVPYALKGAGFYQLIFNPKDHPELTNEQTFSIDFKDSSQQIRSLALTTRYTSSHPVAIDSHQDGIVACDERRDELLFLNTSGDIKRYPTLDGPFKTCSFSNENTPNNQNLMIAHRYSRDLLYLNPKTEMNRRLSLPGIPTAITKLQLNHTNCDWLVATHAAPASLLLVDGENGKVKARLPMPGIVDHLLVLPDQSLSMEALSTDGIQLIAASRQMREIYQLQFFALPSLGDTPAIESGYFVLNEARPLARPAIDLKITPDGNQIWLCCTGYEEEGQEITANHHIEDGILVLDSQSLQTVDWRPTKLMQQNKGAHHTRGISPMSITFHGPRALVTFAGSHEIRVYPWTSDPKYSQALQETAFKNQSIDLKALGLSTPTAISIYDDQVFILCSPTGEIGILNQEGHLRHCISLFESDKSLKQQYPENWESIQQRQQGAAFFYEGTREGISCQSCHTRGDSDYVRHNIGGDTLVGTLSTEGIAGTSPYLRDASYNRLRDVHAIHEELFGGFESGPSMAYRALCIEKWLGAKPLPFHPNLIADMSVPQSTPPKGWLAFKKAGCANCHTLPLTSNLTEWPSRWLFPEEDATTLVLDTPTLFGLWRSAPYLHDGRAYDLESLLIETNPLGKHGQAHLLDEQERKDLIEWLKSF